MWDYSKPLLEAFCLHKELHQIAGSTRDTQKALIYHHTGAKSTPKVLL